MLGKSRHINPMSVIVDHRRNKNVNQLCQSLCNMRNWVDQTFDDHDLGQFFTLKSNSMANEMIELCNRLPI